jgi:ubiquinone/menaquinone biosynthesis C-methylase UbiE
MKTDSAHVYWDAEWQKSDATSPWAQAEAEVLTHAATLASGSQVLDLGAGIGRHALAFARLGHRVTALDASESAVSTIRRAALNEALHLDVTLAPMTELPFPDNSFDHVLSWNVIYHGDENVVRRTLAEIARVLRPGGSFMATMLSARRLPVEQANARGHEVSPGTWIFEGEGDKVHPHYFCTAAQLTDLLSGFELWTLADREHEKPGSWHWHLLAERL